jgi:hypothetical protein
MSKHAASAVICTLLATSVAATFNAAHEGLEGHTPRSGGADRILTQVNDAFLGADRRTFLDLAEYLSELRPTRTS